MITGAADYFLLYIAHLKIVIKNKTTAMKLVLICIAIMGTLYSLYYQLLFFIFNNFTRSSKTDGSSPFLKEMLPEIVTMTICILFLIMIIKELFKTIRCKQ